MYICMQLNTDVLLSRGASSMTASKREFQELKKNYYINCFKILRVYLRLHNLKKKKFKKNFSYFSCYTADGAKRRGPASTATLIPSVTQIIFEIFVKKFSIVFLTVYTHMVKIISTFLQPAIMASRNKLCSTEEKIFSPLKNEGQNL